MAVASLVFASAPTAVNRLVGNIDLGGFDLRGLWFDRLWFDSVLFDGHDALAFQYLSPSSMMTGDGVEIDCRQDDLCGTER
jgi:hypothetical protein